MVYPHLNQDSDFYPILLQRDDLCNDFDAPTRDVTHVFKDEIVGRTTKLSITYMKKMRSVTAGEPLDCIIYSRGCIKQDFVVKI